MAKKVFEVGVPGADQTLPEVGLRLNGVEYDLCFDFAAIAQVELELGVNMLEEAVGPLTFERVAVLLYAAAKRDRPELTLEQVRTLVDLRTVFEIRAAVLVAWGASVSEPKQGGAPGESRRLRKKA